MSLPVLTTPLIGNSARTRSTHSADEPRSPRPPPHSGRKSPDRSAVGLPGLHDPAHRKRQYFTGRAAAPERAQQPETPGTVAQSPGRVQAQHTSAAAPPRGCRNEDIDGLGSRIPHRPDPRRSS
ncbi:hypothetical protein NDU88_006272 [Pleurodeles waltl]|uniref:Uncharacterized protein n=1 Tax=Pleurodeles waltl TaxID=8319 RepID=A0AAV7N2Z2_PLEWA|nr:hypothetical protein NDU88_006272 [Pleurodeles waltl]